MKVGILTFHSSYNFGANLQTLAVQELFRSKGCQPIVIDYRDPWKTEMLRSSVAPAQAEAHERFVDAYLNMSPRFCCEKEVQEYCDDYLDVVAVGSDQVFRLLSQWDPKLLLRRLRGAAPSSSWTRVNDHLPVYYLPWPKGGSARPRRVAVAACAVGMSCFYLGKTLRKEAKRSLCNFDFVSVRDNWTRIVVKWLSGGRVRPVLCPDPVFGLNECFHVPQDEIPNIDVSKTILVSVQFDKNWLAAFRDLAHDRGLTISNLPDTTGSLAFEESDFSIDLPLSPLAWYALLSRSAGYIGSRFHGLVSCIANRTPTISVDWSNKPRLLKSATRTYDVCRKAAAHSRYMSANWFVRPSPIAVMRNLIDEPSQIAMNRYAEQARTHLNHVIDEIVEGVGLKQ